MHRAQLVHGSVETLNWRVSTCRQCNLHHAPPKRAMTQISAVPVVRLVCYAITAGLRDRHEVGLLRMYKLEAQANYYSIGKGDARTMMYELC